LSVYEAVMALPAGQRARMLTVGNQLRLVPQALVKSTDLPKEQAQKRKVMSQVTSQYFARGAGHCAERCAGCVSQYGAG
jgi:hypothetical protein